MIPPLAFTCSKLTMGTLAQSETFSKLTIKTPCSSVSIVNFEHATAGCVVD